MHFIESESEAFMKRLHILSSLSVAVAFVGLLTSCHATMAPTPVRATIAAAAPVTTAAPAGEEAAMEETTVEEGSPREEGSALGAVYESVSAKVAIRDWVGAKREIDDARTAAAGSTPEERFEVDYLQAMVETYHGDLEAAAKMFLGHVKGAPSLLTEAASHSALSILREAQGDIQTAMMEASEDSRVTAYAKGTNSPPDESRLLFMDAWHRAYFSRMAAERASGSRREAALYYGQQAREQCRDLSLSLSKYQAEVATLDAYFASLDGNKEGALSAARRVPLDSSDVENLYLTAWALEIGGEKEAAADLRRRILARAPSLSVAIVSKWLEHDRAGTACFSPRHPKASWSAACR